MLPVSELELIGAILIAVALAVWLVARRNQRGTAPWPDPMVIVAAGTSTISLIAGIAFVLDGVL